MHISEFLPPNGYVLNPVPKFLLESKEYICAILRHPNYFGEILLWFGLFGSASSVFEGYQYLSVLCPIFVYLLITQLSGVPMLEKAGMKKWGHLAAYKEYIAKTPTLVPFT